MATNGSEVKHQNGQQDNFRHQEVGHKSLLQSDALYQVQILLYNYKLRKYQLV